MGKLSTSSLQSRARSMDAAPASAAQIDAVPVEASLVRTCMHACTRASLCLCASAHGHSV